MKNQYDYLNDAHIDLSIYEEECITEEDVQKMTISKNRRTGIKKKAVILSAAAVLAVATGVAASEGHIEKIIRSFTTGHNLFIQLDPNASHDLPKEVIGKLYDENGQVITAITDGDIKNMYDKDSSRLTQEQVQQIFYDALGTDVISADEKNAATESRSTIEEARSMVEFDIKYPEYVPQGFSFNRAYAYKNDDGSISGYYITLEYTNDKGEEITIMERLLNDETAFEMSTDGELEEMMLNGRRTIINDGRSADFETEDNVSVSIHTKNCVSKDELIRMTESIK